ncbi:MAG: DUF4442 domain-containing protein [Gammaproteobacteria bacterium]|nr:DUF4442 domain-containing protein [Gammaproteobacteria bacterium]
MSSIYQRYQKLSGLPAGRYIFDKAIGFAAPFFGKIKPRVIDLRPGYCEVEIKDRWGVRNHLGTVNAGALCSLAELTGGMALDSLVPANMRWIPRGMTVSYLKKATGTLNAISELTGDAVLEGDISVPIIVRNRENDTVFTANITFYVSKKKPPQAMDSTN